jgi:YidC/Oxa1 family membrane protein insertase
MSTATDKTQRILFLALPFVFVIFVINFPAGLLLYWITTNFWTIIQQTIVRKRLGPMRPATAGDESPPMSIMDRMLHGRDGSRAPNALPKADANGSDTAEPAAGTSAAARGRSAPAKARPAAPPPRSPRKKKKRSGRRR